MALSVPVLLTPVSVLGVGIFVLFINFPSTLLIILGAVIAAIGYFLFPKTRRPDGQLFTSTDLPKTFDFVDQVAAKLECQSVDHIVFSKSYNASIANYGRRGGWVLALGLPLWATLNEAEKIAVLSHELAHRKNGDPNRGTVLGYAFELLHQWKFFSPTKTA